MANTNIRVVQGFTVASFVVKQDVVRIVLQASKDEIRAGDGDVGDVLSSLELHCTAGDSAPVELTLARSMDDAE
jgi:hypothetical protein